MTPVNYQPYDFDRITMTKKSENKLRITRDGKSYVEIGYETRSRRKITHAMERVY